jgi:arsenate reductase-like glutaredoxin family protein
VDIDKTPPSAELLARAIAQRGIRNVWNTHSPKYREHGVGQKEWTTAAAVTLMRSEPNLIRRPFVVAGATILQGFDEAEFAGLVKKK